MAKRELDTFTAAYIECALWSSSADGSPEQRKADPDNEGRFDRSFQDCGYDKLGSQLRAQIVRDCKAFQRDNADLLAAWYSECGETEERAGHDFWLTRTGHGAGFWDRWNGGTPQGKIGQELSERAKVYGEVNLYWHRGRIVA